MISLTVHRESFALAEVFTISRGSRTQADVIRVELQAQGKWGQGTLGQGECVPYARYGESLDSVASAIEETGRLLSDVSDCVEARQIVNQTLPAGAARNALDCALWDLDSKVQGQRAWQLAGVSKPAFVTTAYTLSLADPAKMQAKAAEHASRPLLKIKLGGSGDVERLRAVRSGAPDSRIIVDANEGWTPEDYLELAPVLLELGVEMVEQPFPASDDAALLGLERSLPVCADESCHDVASLPALAGKYDMVNIKLDKTGGLTEAIALERAARDAGYGIMVGCMVGTSLAMAPALLVSNAAVFVDLDGPLLLAEDRAAPLQFDGSQIAPADAALWG